MANIASLAAVGVERMTRRLAGSVRWPHPPNVDLAVVTPDGSSKGSACVMHAMLSGVKTCRRVVSAVLSSTYNEYSLDGREVRSS